MSGYDLYDIHGLAQDDPDSVKSSLYRGCVLGIKNLGNCF